MILSNQKANKSNIKSSQYYIVFSLAVFLFSIFVNIISNPQSVSADTLTTKHLAQLAADGSVKGKNLNEAQLAAKRNADRHCAERNDVLRTKAGGTGQGSEVENSCRLVYIAAYLGENIGDYDISGNDNENTKTGQEAVQERKRDFIQIENPNNGVCMAYIRAAQGSRVAPQALRNLNNRNQIIRANQSCLNGVYYGLNESSNDCNNLPRDYMKMACISGVTLANEHEFTRSGARAKASGNPAPNTSEDRERQTGTNEDNAVEDVDCEGGFGFGWVICPLFELGANMTQDVFEKMIRPMMENVPVRANGPFYDAWQNFRILGNLVLVGAMLALVYGMIRNGGSGR